MRLGVLGGSFNPIHHGHLITAAHAAEAVKLDRVLFIPVAVSPLRSASILASPRDRWTMLKAAIRGDARFEASDLELKRGGRSYTVDTLRELRKSTGARLYLILGADSAAQLHRWKSPEEIGRLATLVVLARPGGPKLRPIPLRHLLVDAPLLEISSTEIRARARAGRPLRYFVPEAVDRHIRKKRLYRR
jgi:nicotinate-nucleotide adenylyltransferase